MAGKISVGKDRIIIDSIGVGSIIFTFHIKPGPSSEPDVATTLKKFDDMKPVLTADADKNIEKTVAGAVTKVTSAPTDPTKPTKPTTLVQTTLSTLVHAVGGDTPSPSPCSQDWLDRIERLLNVGDDCIPTSPSPDTTSTGEKQIRLVILSIILFLGGIVINAAKGNVALYIPICIGIIGAYAMWLFGI